MAGKKLKQWSWFLLLYVAGIVAVGTMGYLLKWIIGLL
jgi:hypothetical protein